MPVDYCTHPRNSKGEITDTRPYSCHVINGVKVFCQPKVFEGYQLENGEPCDSQGNPLPKKMPEPVVAPKAMSKPEFKGAKEQVNAGEL